MMSNLLRLTEAGATIVLVIASVTAEVLQIARKWQT
jgi:hypothetical protein